jgi:hypothetical protein
MVTNTGLVKLIDFGIARTYKAGKKRDTVAMGSENYAAPEQWGKGQTDARSDLYALGATMYHLLANMAPTPAFLPSEPLPLGNYNGAVTKQTIRLVGKAMERDRQRRYQSANEMRDALVDALPGPYVPPAAQAAAPKAIRTAPEPVLARPQAKPQAQPAQGALPPVPSAPTASPHPRPVPKPDKACPSCRRSNKADARFCVGCGHSFIPLQPAILRVIEPVRAAWEMPVARSPMLLGRASEAEGFQPDFDMTFYDEGDYVSRRHARITKGRAGYFVADLGSSNGTTVNGHALDPTRAYQLRNGDRIKVGLVVIQFWLR